MGINLNGPPATPNPATGEAAAEVDGTQQDDSATPGGDRFDLSSPSLFDNRQGLQDFGLVSQLADDDEGDQKGLLNNVRSADNVQSALGEFLKGLGG